MNELYDIVAQSESSPDPEERGADIAANGEDKQAGGGGRAERNPGKRGAGPGTDETVRPAEGGKRSAEKVKRQQPLQPDGRAGRCPGEADGSLRRVRGFSHCGRRAAEDRRPSHGKTARRLRQTQGCPHRNTGSFLASFFNLLVFPIFHFQTFII